MRPFMTLPVPNTGKGKLKITILERNYECSGLGSIVDKEGTELKITEIVKYKQSKTNTKWCYLVRVNGNLLMPTMKMNNLLDKFYKSIINLKG